MMSYVKSYKLFESKSIDDINDLFLPIIDLGCEYIVDSPYCDTTIDISWKYKMDLSMDGISDLERHRSEMNIFHEIVTEVYEILNRINDMGFVVDFYSIDFNMGINYKEANFDLILKKSKNV